MPGPQDVIEVVRITEQEIGSYRVNWQEFLRAHPELERVPPSRVPGWASALSAAFALSGAMQGGYLEGPQVLVILLQRIADDLRAKMAELEMGTFTPAEAREQIAEIADLQGRLRRGTALLEQATPTSEVVVPSPTQILRQALEQLRRSVAVGELWRRGHHGQIHRPLVSAEGRRAGAEIAVASVTASGLAALAEGIRAVIRVKLPELRHELVTLLREEAQLRRETDREIRTELRTEIRAVVTRIGDVVRWLRTEALPEIREQVRAETRTRTQADRDLRDDLRAERERRVEADLSTQTRLAALIGVTLPPVLHATRKVQRTEGVFDQLLRSGDLNWAAQLLAAGPFVALASRIMGRVAGQVPETLVGLEEAAVRALGAVR